MLLLEKGARDQLLLDRINHEAQDFQGGGPQENEFTTISKRNRYSTGPAIDTDPRQTYAPHHLAIVACQRRERKLRSYLQVAQQVFRKFGQRGAGIHQEFNLPRLCPVLQASYTYVSP